MQGRAQYTGGRTPDDRGDAARSRAATDRAAGRGRPALDTLHAHAADLEDMPLANRRSQKRGLLLLRRHLGAGAAVLRLSSRGCICAAATKVAEVRRQGALPAARQAEFVNDEQQRLLEIEDMRLVVKFGDKKRYSDQECQAIYQELIEAGLNNDAMRDPDAIEAVFRKLNAADEAETARRDLCG
jgi:hypothetical protein